MTDILSDQQKQYFTNRLTDRMRWARHAEKVYFNTTSDDGPDGMWNVAYKSSGAADEEVCDCIREIARACRFRNDLIEPITSAAWTASKEDS